MNTYRVNISQIVDEMEEAGFDIRNGMTGFSDTMLDTLQKYIDLEADIYNEICKREEERDYER